MSSTGKYLSESRGWWKRGRDGLGEWAFEGRPNVATPVGESEWFSVIKAGVCLYAVSGRDIPVKPGGTAEVSASVPATIC